MNTENIAVNFNAWDAILAASPIVQITLLILIAMSIVSWAIIFSKNKIFKQLTEQDKLFESHYEQADSLDTIYEKLSLMPNSSVGKIFKSGYDELQRVAAAANIPKTDNNTVQLSGINNVQRSLNRSIDNEIEGLEQRLSILATTGSTAPFIGLFGTVWGIMGAFQKIGTMKTASLAVVAPGISEALIATAIGLVTAIPAVMAYNHFITKIKKSENRLTNFASDYLNIIKTNFFKD